MDTKQMIGARIKEIRNRKGVTQEDIAARMEISPKYLSSIERGKENPTLNTLINLAQALNGDIGDIFSSIQIEDPAKRKTLLNELLKDADEEQLKTAFRVLSAIIR